MEAAIYKMRDLRAVPGYFRRNRRYGRTTKLVHLPTGRVLHEVMGVVPKGELHSMFLDFRRRQIAAIERRQGRALHPAPILT